jgi:Tfp pilus assembly protein PilN
VAMTVYGVLLLAGYVMCFAFSDEETEAAFRDMRNVAARARELDREIRSLRAEIAGTKRELAAAQAVAGHPDWSLLLAVLAHAVPEEVVLRRCVLTPVEEDDREAADSQDTVAGLWSGEDGADGRGALAASLNRSYRLEVGGFARTQAAVSQFVLRLEKIALFDQVKLIKTNRQLFLEGQAVAFELECSLDGRRRLASR